MGKERWGWGPAPYSGSRGLDGAGSYPELWMHKARPSHQDFLPQLRSQTRPLCQPSPRFMRLHYEKPYGAQRMRDDGLSCDSFTGSRVSGGGGQPLGATVSNLVWTTGSPRHTLVNLYTKQEKSAQHKPAFSTCNTQPGLCCIPSCFLFLFLFFWQMLVVSHRNDVMNP